MVGVSGILDSNALATSVAGEQTEAKKDQTRINGEFDNFIKIFLKQLEEQDPLEPRDSSQVAADIAQFSTVEQLAKQNVLLEDFVSLFDGFGLSTAASYAGSRVKAEGHSFHLNNGAADISYEIENEANFAEIIITDKTGTEVRREEVDNSTGKHTYNFDGLDKDGNPLDDGVYEVEVKIRDSENEPGTAKTVIEAIVQGVDMENIDDGDFKLILNTGEVINSSDVKFLGAKEQQPEVEEAA